MGTSLSGLTPATTFDGLLKVGDNDPLTATLKPISTGDGTDTILDLSTTAFKVSGETIVEGATTGDFFKVRNASNPTQEFYIEKVDDALNRFNAGTDTTYITYRDGAHLRFVVGGTTHAQLANTGDLSIGLGGSNASARMHIKGSGATSATTSLLVQNSAGTELLKVTDNGIIEAQNLEINGGATSPLIFAQGNTGKSIRLGNEAFISSFNSVDIKTWDGSAYSEAMRITGNTSQFVGIGETTPTARLHIKGSGNTNTTTSLLVQNSDGADMVKVTDDGIATIGTTGQQGEINLKRPQDGLAIGKIQGTNNGLYLTNQDGSNHMLIGNSSTRGVSVGDGSASAMGARFGIKGSGATSATTSFLVQNSAGTELFKVQDDGRVNVALGLKISNLNVIDWDAGTSAVRYFYQSGVGNHVFYTNSGTERMKLNNDGNLGIAESTPTARLQVKGSGATSATTALLVENSAGVERLKVRDDGWVDLPGTLNGGSIRANTLQVDSINFKVDGTNNYFQSQFTNNVFGGVNTDGDASALVTMKSTTQGFLPPRMTTTERDAISTPAAGLMVYNTTTNKAQCYNGTAWQDLF